MLCTILCALCLCLVSMAILFSNNRYMAYASANEISISSELFINERLQNENRSLSLHNQLMPNFRSEVLDANGCRGFVYDDDFAGAFIDTQGILNIGIVSNSNISKTMQNSFGLDGQAVFRDFTYSYNHLNAIMETLIPIKLNHGIFTIAIYQRYNHVAVYLDSEEKVQPTVAYLQRAGLFSETALSFVVDSNAMDEDNIRVPYGGDRINRTATSWGTLGVGAICNATGFIGVLTNEHVAPVGTTMQHGGVVIGTALRGQTQGTIDASFIPFVDQAAWSNTPHARRGGITSTNIRLGNESQIVEGRQVKRIGDSTNTTWGTITATNATSIVTGRPTITNVFRYSNDGEGGDSGGPVYFVGANSLYLIGLHFRSGGTPRTGAAVRISNIMNILNVTPITNDLYNPTNVGAGVQVNGFNFTPRPTGALVIPSMFNGRQTTHIGANAFSGSLWSILTLPSTVTTIGSRAFMNARHLLTVGFMYGSRLTEIGTQAFYGASRLREIFIPNGVTYIRERTFLGAHNLSTVVLPPSLRRIGYRAFQDTHNLRHLHIPFALDRIDNGAFINAYSLQSLWIWGSISVGNNVFLRARSLRIYTNAPSRPAHWHTNFNPSQRPVHWGSWFQFRAELYYEYNYLAEK